MSNHRDKLKVIIWSISRKAKRGGEMEINRGSTSRQSNLLFWGTILFTLMIQSCYSSTAIKGTPVSELILAQDEKVVAKAPTKENREAIIKMSKVTGNKVFSTIDGIPEYRIGPLDVLEIHSRKGDTVTLSLVTVNNRGRISYSFVDNLKAAGLTPSQLDDLLTEKLSDYVRNPRIDILIKEFRSKTALLMGELASFRQSNLSGSAASGRIFLRGKTTLMDLIVQAGGYTVDADIKNVKVTRGGTAYHINLYDILEKGEKSLDLIIDAGDVVNIPLLPEFGERVYVLGEVVKQGIYSLRDAQDLLAAISLAGSFTRLAREDSTLIVRGYGPGKKPLVMMSDLNALLTKADLTQNVRLQDGDLVYVPRMRIGDINDWIKNTKPLLDFLFYPADYETRYSDDRFLFLKTGNK